ncbi:FapA family protein [Oceanotoga sp. DSM 15011]|jgi:hypothetical protein|uniref:Flagellar Assembly Protein A N-terminal region domain-containing protein n=1 Tax=Oceanotoga teriensis TaxID=515440 RepID=A0AA45C8N2_9BACT|nr:MULTISPECIES: FapA family protein [Oceanotoga]MDN5342404.1 uncharacterized protein [Oceanotoga sp.]MDO7975515.1 FapA family protein [Oceanotoga teriensis]PWJ96197.1 hypothetical protein C7380_102108 [Oceanotoga teriensis]UYO99980.1 FapA family protein [Oceanotoga sp. DSM 15011]
MAKLNFKSSGDNMLATITMTDDGKHVSKNEILAFLNENKVKYGIQENIINDMTADPQYDREYPVAYGIGPKKGGNGSLEMVVKKKKTEISQDYINMKERSNIISIEKDEIIAKIIPPSKGQSGMDIFGNEIEGLDGEAVKVTLGKNALINENLIIAFVSGELILNKENDLSYYIDVSQIHRIDGDIDYSTGNVRFPGTVIVNGNVMPGFVIEADDDIEITGIVEGATLIAGGNIKANGIKGAGKGIIKCREIFVNYIENANLDVEEKINVTQSIINSNIKSGNKVIVQDKNGRISGGVITAGQLIEASYIGSKMNVKTTLEVGVSPSLNEELTIIESQIAIDIENLRKLSLILKGLMKLKKENKLDQNKMMQYKKSLETAKQLKAALGENELKLNRIKKAIQNSKFGGKIIVKEILYPGSELIVHKKKFFPNTELTKTIFLVHEDKIVMKGYNESEE